jgi:signal transduction histidine kinase
VLPHLSQYLDYVRDDIGNPPNLGRAASVAQRLKTDLAIVTSASTWTSWGGTFDRQRVHVRKEIDHAGVHYAVVDFAERRWLIVTFPQYELVTALPERYIRFDIQRLWPVVAILALMIIFYYAARRVIAPIETIRFGVQRFGQGDFSHRLPVCRDDELGALAGSINTMAGEIERMLEAKRQLLLAVSHELRTPLTRAKVSAALVENDGQRQEIERDLTDVDLLLGEILETERLQGHHVALATVSLDLTEWLREFVISQGTVNAVTLELPSHPVPVSVDPMRLRMLLRNVLDNARRHNTGAQKPPRLQLVVSGDEIILSIHDYGTGIESRHLPHLTEPFYRADPSRQRETGGYGMGLYLCHLIVQAHGGRLEIESVVGEGTTVKARFPKEKTTFLNAQ